MSLYLLKMDRKVGQAMSSGTVLYCSSLALNLNFKDSNYLCWGLTFIFSINSSISLPLKHTVTFSVCLSVAAAKPIQMHMPMNSFPDLMDDEVK